MKPTCLMDAIGLLEEDILMEADARRIRAPHAHLRRAFPWAVAAVCLCALLLCLRIPASPPNAPTSPESMGPPTVTVEGTDYIVSPYIAVEDACPPGFREGGILSTGETYYVDAAHPLWVYVRHVGDTDAPVYVRYVDARLRGRALVCTEGNLYISLWSADSTPDLNHATVNRIRSVYGLRIEGDVPDGFTCLGRAVFTGEDTLPSGSLASNTGEETVYRSPDGEVLLVSTVWHTAVDGTEQRHTGFNIYMRWDDPPF